MSAALVASRHWHWRAGMEDAEGRRVVEVDQRGVPSVWFVDGHLVTGHGLGWAELSHGAWRDALPNLDDGPTRGAVLDLVREAYRDPEISVRHVGRYAVTEADDDRGDWVRAWQVVTTSRHVTMPIGFEFPTEAEALAAALLAAPVPR